MAEEFKKYKDILAREQKEFREEMEGVVGAFLSFQFIKEKPDLKWVWLDIVMNFAILLLNLMVCSLYHSLWQLFKGLDQGLSSYEVVLALYEREVGPKPEKVHHFFEHVVSKRY